MSAEPRTANHAEEVTRALLFSRNADATICPSEVARELAKSDASDVSWRHYMPMVHAATDVLVATEEVTLSWKGNTLFARSGPYRIGRASDT